MMVLFYDNTFQAGLFCDSIVPIYLLMMVLFYDNTFQAGLFYDSIVPIYLLMMVLFYDNTFQAGLFCDSIVPIYLLMMVLFYDNPFQAGLFYDIIFPNIFVDYDSTSLRQYHRIYTVYKHHILFRRNKTSGQSEGRFVPFSPWLCYKWI